MRRAVIVTTLIAFAMLVTVWFLRQSLVQGELREAVETRVSAMLGERVSIGHLGISFVPRLGVTGTGVRVGDERTQAPGVTIERIRILPRVRSLLSSSAVIEQVLLDGFVVSVLHGHDGWHLPATVPSPGASGDGAFVIERVRLAGACVRVFDRADDGGIHERSSIDGLNADVMVDGGALRLSSITGRIGGAAIRGSARVHRGYARLELAADRIADDDLPEFLQLLGAGRPEFLHLTEPGSLSATLDVNRSTSHLSGKGMLQAPQVRLDPLRMQGFAAPFVIDGSRLTFDPATFAVYEGAHTGTVNVALDAVPPEWTTDSHVNGVDAGAFLKALTGRDQRLDGRASLDGVLRGRVGEPLAQTVRGRARIAVAGGVIREFPLIAYINRALRLAEHEGNDTRFERLSATLSIASGAAVTDDLVLLATHVRVTAAGRIGADRSLALHGTAAISPARSAAAIASIHELSGLRNARGELEIPLTISGTLDAPAFNLDVGSVIRKGLADELRRQLRRIIREPPSAV